MTQAPVTDARARSLALRLLSGCGAASMHAYRLGLCISSMAHGVVDGRLLVACQPEAGWLLENPVEVRVDLVLHTQQAHVAITAASAHALGMLTWLDEREMSAISGRGLPGLLDAPLAAGGRLGIVEVSRLVLHDFTGATALDLSDPLPEPQPFVDEWTAQELVSGLGEHRLRDICWAVMVGAIPGEVVTRPAPTLCEHVTGRAFVVDVDPNGLTVMVTSPDEVIAAFAAFETPALTAADLNWSLTRLANDSEPTRTLRI